MTPGLVVAWVDPDGPAAGALAAGDLLVGINGRRLIGLPGFDLSSLDRATFMVERGERSRSVYVEAEAWPRDVNFFMVEYASPNAGPSQQGVVVSSSLLDLLEDEDQLAVVLGHELAHLLLGHVPVPGHFPGPGYTRATTRGISRRGNTTRWNAKRRRMAGKAGFAFDREAERRADLLGVDLAEAAGYRGSAFARVMQLLEESAGGRAHTFLDHHPDYPQRAMLVQHHLEDRAVAGQMGKGSL
jgi:Zn-dependent protease with chaperone function